MRMCRAKYRLAHSPVLFFVSPSLSQLSEAEFWKRYFQSKLFHSHRASIRSTATQHVVRDDAMEPRKPRDEEVDMFIDLEATREDHEEVRDLTFHGLFHTCVDFTMIM